MSSFTYTQNIPFATNSPSQDQPNMLTNTNSTAGILGVDLYSFGSSGNNDGYHQKSTYVVQGSDPSSISGQIIEYAKTSSGNSELFVVRDGSGTPIQMTRGNVVTGGNQSNGYTFLPGGIIYQWGATNYDGTNKTLSFPTPFPANCFNVVITPSISSAIVGIVPGMTNNSGFKLDTTSSATFTLFFFAVGN
jgi:hypothetical protein